MQQAAQLRKGFARWSSLWLQKESYVSSSNETQASFAWGATIAGEKDLHQVTRASLRNTGMTWTMNHPPLADLSICFSPCLVCLSFETDSLKKL